MTKIWKPLLAGGIVLTAVFLSFVLISYLSVQNYMNNNTWSKTFISISDNGVEEGEPIIGDYAQGDLMDIYFDNVYVEKVRSGKGIRFSTASADILYQGEVYHSLTLNTGEACEIRKGNKTALVRIDEIWGY